MSTKPILFSTPMVEAIIEGQKTMTRRVIQNQEGIRPRWNNIGWAGWDDGHGRKMRHSFDSGDVLWVRETWCNISDWTRFDPSVWFPDSFIYKAYWHARLEHPRWRPSIHMPKAAARIFLRVTDVRVERVQDITDDDSLSEGIPYDLGFPMDKVYCPRCNGEGLIGSFNARSLGYQEVECPQCQTAKQRFANLWDSLNAKRGYGWDKNPWVWVYSFERVDKPAGWPGGEVEG